MRMQQKQQRRNYNVRKRSNQNYTYATSSQPVRYGPGKNLAIINNFHNISANALTRISINNDILNSNEYIVKASIFKYFKILSVKAIFYPINSSGGTMLINLNWFQTSSAADYLEKDDSTKIVTAYRTRTKVFTWFPPHMIINVNSTSQDIPLNFINVSEFNSTDRIIDLPGWLFIQNNNANSYNFNLEIRVAFRGNDYFNNVTRFKNLLNKKATITELEHVMKMPQKEDEKKEEDKKEEDKIVSEEDEEKVDFINITSEERKSLYE
jgi:hypothetical protein